MKQKKLNPLIGVLLTSATVFIAYLCLCSCDGRKIEPDTITYVTFANNSGHKVSVAFEGAAPWCKVEDFSIESYEKVSFSYEGLGIDLFKAVVTYDNKTSIVHARSEEPIAEGFRNICYTDSTWWERLFEQNAGYKAYYTFTFEESDYTFALNHR